MPASDPAHTETNTPKPLVYAAPCLVVAGGIFVTGVVFLVLALDDHENIPARLFSATLLVLGVVGAGCTALCWRVDVARREARVARVKARDHAERLAGEIADTIIDVEKRAARALDELLAKANATLVQVQAIHSLTADVLEVGKANREALRQPGLAHQPRPRRRRRAKGGSDYAKDFVDRAINEEAERKLRLIKPDDEPGGGRRLRGDSGDR